MTTHPHVEHLLGLFLVKGTKVPVSRLHFWHQKGIPVATLMRRYPTLKPAQLLDALSFSYDHPNLMAEDLQKLGAQHPPEEPSLEYVQLSLPYQTRRSS